jgi:hypothetical protein
VTGAAHARSPAGAARGRQDRRAHDLMPTVLEPGCSCRPASRASRPAHRRHRPAAYRILRDAGLAPARRLPSAGCAARALDGAPRCYDLAADPAELPTSPRERHRVASWSALRLG